MQGSRLAARCVLPCCLVPSAPEARLPVDAFEMSYRDHEALTQYASRSPETDSTGQVLGSWRSGETEGRFKRVHSGGNSRDPWQQLSLSPTDVSITKDTIFKNIRTKRTSALQKTYSIYIYIPR